MKYQKRSVERKFDKWGRALKDRELKLSRNKTEHTSFNEDSSLKVWMQGERSRTVEKFTYPRSMMEENGELDEEVVRRIQMDLRKLKTVVV